MTSLDHDLDPSEVDDVDDRHLDDRHLDDRHLDGLRRLGLPGRATPRPRPPHRRHSPSLADRGGVARGCRRPRLDTGEVPDRVDRLVRLVRPPRHRPLRRRADRCAPLARTAPPPAPRGVHRAGPPRGGVVVVRTSRATLAGEASDDPAGDDRLRPHPRYRLPAGAAVDARRPAHDRRRDPDRAQPRAQPPTGRARPLPAHLGLVDRSPLSGARRLGRRGSRVPRRSRHWREWGSAGAHRPLQDRPDICRVRRRRALQPPLQLVPRPGVDAPNPPAGER